MTARPRPHVKNGAADFEQIFDDVLVLRFQLSVLRVDDQTWFGLVQECAHFLGGFDEGLLVYELQFVEDLDIVNLIVLLNLLIDHAPEFIVKLP